MADPRLQWRQLSQAQPNVAGLMRGAGESLNNAATAAKGILADYASGQELKAENELAKRIGGRSQEELTAMFEKGAFNDLNLGEQGLATLNDAIGGRSTVDNTNSTVRDRDGRLGIAQNRDSREGEKFAWATDDRNDSLESRNALRSAAPLGVQAESISRELGKTGTGTVVERKPGTFNRIGDHVFGNADPGTGPVQGNTGPMQADENTRLMLARTLQAEAGNQGPEGMLAVGAVIRNRAAAGKYGDGLQGVIMKPGQFSAWNGATEYRNGEQGQNMNFQPNAEALAAADAVLAGQYEDVTGGATHYYNPDISQPKWGGPINERPTSSAGALTSYQQALIDSGQFSAQQILAESQPIRTAMEGGEKENDTANTEYLNELIASANQDILNNPDIVTPAQVRQAVFADDRFTATENETRYNQIRDLVSSDPGRLAPAVSDADLIETDTIIGNTLGAADRAIDANPQTSLLSSADRLTADDSASVGQKLTDLLNLGSDDPENPSSFIGFGESGFNQSNLDRHLAQAAARNNVPEEVAAAAMARAFNPDPFGRNTLDNRFDPDAVDEIIQSLTQQDQRDYDEARGNVTILRAEMQAVRNQEAIVRAQLQKYPPDSQQHQSLRSTLQNLQKQMSDLEGRLSTSETK